MRKLCKSCQIRPVALNYYKEGKAYYRSKCDHCSRMSNEGIPKWKRAGYKLKTKCDRCGFASRFPQQFNVFHVDGNLDNCRYDNLKSICANCQRILHTEGMKWRQGDLKADF